jgi:hypothetical protein
MGVGIGIALAVQNHFAAERHHRVDLQLRRGDRHHHQGLATELARAQRHALCMVAGGGADHAAGEFVAPQMRHLVVGAAQLEAEHGLAVFALEQHMVAQAPRQGACRLQRRLDRHVVDAGVEDALEVVAALAAAGRWACHAAPDHRAAQKKNPTSRDVGLKPPLGGGGDNRFGGAACPHRSTEFSACHAASQHARCGKPVA